MNRAQRRAQARSSGPSRMTPRVREAVTTTFQDRISWTAAAVLLQRTVADPAFAELEPGLREGIVRFLERHPAPVGWDEPAAASGSSTG